MQMSHRSDQTVFDASTQFTHLPVCLPQHIIGAPQHSINEAEYNPVFSQHSIGMSQHSTGVTQHNNGSTQHSTSASISTALVCRTQLTMQAGGVPTVPSKQSTPGLDTNTIPKVLYPPSKTFSRPLST